MHLCVECLHREQPQWLGRYLLGSYLLLLYAAAAFLLLEGMIGTAAQALFFLIAFPWIVWPLVAALRPRKS